MLWSDGAKPTPYRSTPRQAAARFPFGRRRFRSFMARLGLNTMVRGHERVVEGFWQIYDAPASATATA